MLGRSVIAGAISLKGLLDVPLRVRGRRAADKAGPGGLAGAGADPARSGRAVVRAAVLALAAAALTLLAGPGAGVGQVPDGRWRSFETEHFRVTFPERLEALARETGGHAERAWALLAPSFERTPEGRVEILVTDHADSSNGFATVAPYPKVTIWARPPVDGFALSHFDDWLELVVTHEVAHIFHLQAGGSLARVLRTVFGSVPVGWPFYPQYTVPEWTVEGLATWYESSLTGQGRVRGTFHDMVLRTAALEGRFEDLDEASGSSPVWPSGARTYIYGSIFLDHLLAAYGPDRVDDFVARIAGQWIPFRVDRAARDAFGVSFTAAWREWSQAYTAGARARVEALGREAPLTEPTRLTSGARNALYPLVSPDGGTLVYARSDGRSDAQLVASLPDGTSPRKLTRTNLTVNFTFLPDGGIVFAQLDYTDGYRIRSDLYRLDPDGSVRRLTRAARLEQPSGTPDGRVVAVQQGEGLSWLVEVDPGTGEVRRLTSPASEALWAFPRVSPDGRWIAASRWRSGGIADVVVLDRSGRVVTEVTRDRAADLAPTWSPDGAWILWGSERSGIPNLYAVAFEDGGVTGPLRQVTNLATGAAFPSVDPRGRWIHFSGYHADGWEIERIPFDPAGWLDPAPLDPRFLDDAVPADPPPPSASPSGGYDPLSSLRPRYWSPQLRPPVTAGGGREILSTAVGFSTSGQDVVGRHAIDAAALFTLGGGEMDGVASWRWAGLGRPIVGLTARQFWDASGPFLGTRPDSTMERLWLLERERSLAASLTMPVPRYRLGASGTLTAGLVWESRKLLDDRLEPATAFTLTRPRSRLGDLRASFSLSSARGHAFSLGPEAGASLVVEGRMRRELDLADSLSGQAGSDRSLEDLVGRLRLYRSLGGSGFTDRVIALQASGGAASGPGADAFHFDVGGASGERESLTGFGLFGGPLYLFPVRGYANGLRSGRYAWTLALELRFPLFLVHEGKGLLPLHLDRVGGALFADAGNAWGPELGGGGARFENPRGQALASVGGEVTSEVLAFFRTSLSLRLGFAVPLVDEDPSLYLRLGRSF